MVTDGLSDRVRLAIRDIHDFPRQGIVFKDITPVLADALLMRSITHHFVATHGRESIDMVAGIESRGFILGGAIAVALGAGFMPIRKRGKLPHECISVAYDLEYGSDALEAHVDAVTPGARVLVIDDVLATGGTARAAVDLVRQLGGVVTAAAFLLELQFLHGRSRLDDVPVSSLVAFT